MYSNSVTHRYLDEYQPVGNCNEKVWLGENLLQDQRINSIFKAHFTMLRVWKALHKIHQHVSSPSRCPSDTKE